MPGSGRGARLAISAVDAMSPAFQHAKQQLLHPFRFGQWVRLAFVGPLAGEMGSGGGCNGSSGFHWPGKQHPRGSGEVIHAALPGPILHHPALSAGVIALLIVGAMALIVFFMYVSSVMRFILFDSVVTRECHVRQGWRKHSRESDHGWQLFVWQIFLLVVSLAGAAVTIGIPVLGAFSLGWFTHPREHLVPMVLGGGAFLVAFVGLILGLAVVHVMTKDFVVPQMALENISATEGWRRLWISLKTEKGGYGGYIGMKIVLAIGAGVIIGIVTFIVLLVVLVPVGGVGVVAVLGGNAAGLTWNFWTIALAALAGVLVFLSFMFLVALISVPTTVFFPAYSIYFFAPRYAPLSALLWPPAAAPTVPFAPTGPEPPSIPPAPAALS
jgi:hypothetical protein